MAELPIQPAAGGCCCSGPPAAPGVAAAAAAAAAVDDAYGDDFGRLVVLWLSVVPSAVAFQQTSGRGGEKSNNKYYFQNENILV